VPVEPGRPLVTAADEQVHARRAPVPQGGDHRGDQRFPDPASLHARQQVNMQMRGEAGREFVRGSARMVDVVNRVLLGRRQPRIGGRFRVVAAQGGPPVALEPLLEGVAVERPEGVTGHASRVLGHEGERGFERDVGPDVQVSRQHRVTEERRAILAVRGGQQADAVHVVKISRLIPADADRFASHSTLL